MICLFNMYKLHSCRVQGTVVGTGAAQRITEYVLGDDKCYEEKTSKEEDRNDQGCAFK